MAMTPQDIMSNINRELLMSNTTVDEQIEFIREQIKNPFDGGSSNYFKKLKNSVKKDELRDVCLDLFEQIENMYPAIAFDFSDDEETDIPSAFNAVYKFFVRKIQDLILVFLKEYIHNAKNRKVLTAEYMNAKLPNYPKEQYGKKEYYILITKLPAIISDIFDSELRLDKFIECVERSGMSPMYFSVIKDLLDRGIIIDHGVVNNIYDLFKKSDRYDQTICKLQIDITDNMIIPYMEENGLMELRNPPIEPDPVEEDLDDDDDDE